MAARNCPATRRILLADGYASTLRHRNLLIAEPTSFVNPKNLSLKKDYDFNKLRKAGLAFP
ncbi:MAG: hypothetical protein WAZ77_19985 [Candidatus Nitrosopolaris sp.]